MASGAARPTTGRATDLLTGLARDHRRFEARARQLAAGGSGAHARTRGLLVDLLAHSLSERLLLHPLVVGRAEDGTALAAARRASQHRLAEAIGVVAGVPARSSRLTGALETLAQVAGEDAAHEETALHPVLTTIVDPVAQRRLARQHAALIVRLPTQIRVAGVELTTEPTTLVRDVLAVAGELLLDLEVDDVIDLAGLEAPVARRGGGEVVDLPTEDEPPRTLPAS